MHLNAWFKLNQFDAVAKISVVHYISGHKINSEDVNQQQCSNQNIFSKAQKIRKFSSKTGCMFSRSLLLIS